MAEFVFVYTIVKNNDIAEQLAANIVTENLAACANIIPAIRSIYKWNGVLEHGNEAAILFKTTAASYDRLEKRIKELHEYEIPCIVSFDVNAGYKGFLDWIAGQVS